MVSTCCAHPSYILMLGKQQQACMGRAGPKGCQPHSTHTPHFKVGDATLFVVIAVANLKPQTEHGPLLWANWQAALDE